YRTQDDAWWRGRRWQRGLYRGRCGILPWPRWQPGGRKTICARASLSFQVPRCFVGQECAIEQPVPRGSLFIREQVFLPRVVDGGAAAVEPDVMDGGVVQLGPDAAVGLGLRHHLFERPRWVRLR